MDHLGLSSSIPTPGNRFSGNSRGLLLCSLPLTRFLAGDLPEDLLLDDFPGDLLLGHTNAHGQGPARDISTNLIK